MEQSPFERLDEITQRLRVDCPWDREQTHSSLTRHLIEESYELIEAIDEWQPDAPETTAHLVEELGDVLIQVFVHTAIATEAGYFSAGDVARGAGDKLVERHPHVYGEVTASTSDEVMSAWEANKKKAKGRTSVMDGIPSHLPALLSAAKVLRKAAHSGIEVETPPADADLGTRLLALVDEARRDGADPEAELRAATQEFRHRFQRAEAAAEADGVELTRADHDTAQRYWTSAR